MRTFKHINSGSFLYFFFPRDSLNKVIGEKLEILIIKIKYESQQPPQIDLIRMTFLKGFFGFYFSRKGKSLLLL